MFKIGGTTSEIYLCFTETEKKIKTKNGNDDYQNDVKQFLKTHKSSKNGTIAVLQTELMQNKKTLLVEGQMKIGLYDENKNKCLKSDLLEKNS